MATTERQQLDFMGRLGGEDDFLVILGHSHSLDLGGTRKGCLEEELIGTSEVLTVAVVVLFLIIIFAKTHKSALPYRMSGAELDVSVALFNLLENTL